MPQERIRADQRLVQMGLVTTREKAKGLILAGQVFSPKGRVEKGGSLFPAGTVLSVRELPRFVSRGGVKLDHALREFGISVEGKIGLDVGASTGGFTDCLLQRGAERVYSVDVGYGQFDWRLRSDSRVVLMEKTNFRTIDPSRIPETIDVAVVDVSFISLKKILPVVFRLLRSQGECLPLIKPQFELSPSRVKKGVVRSEVLREEAVRGVTEAAETIGFEVLNRTASPILGPKGNQEFFLHLKKILVTLCVPLALGACTHVRSLMGLDVPGGRDASYYYLLADAEARRGNMGKAIDLLDRALEKEATEPTLWHKRASFHASQGDLDKAEADLKKARELDGDHLPSLILLGKIYQSQGKRDEAVSLYRKALEVDPASEDVNVLLLETTLAEKKGGEALRLVQSWSRRDPDNLAPLFYEAWIHQNVTKKNSAAIAVYRKILSMEPENMKALSSLAEIYMGEKNQPKVLEIFRQMAALEPNDVSIHLKMALIYYEHKQYGRAVEKFEELLQKYPESDRIIYYLGVLYENLKRDGEALVQFHKIPPTSSFFKDARLHIGFLLVRGERKEEAIHELQEAIKAKSEVGDFYEYLAEIHLDHQEYTQAIQTLKKGLSSKSAEKESLHYSLGMAYDRAGQFDDCIRSMRKVLEINPQNANAMNYIGYSFADRGLHLDEALGLVQKALELKPNDGYITDSLGWVYFQKGDLERAEETIKKAYKLVPREPTVTEHLGDIYLKKNEKRGALKYYREALSILEGKKNAGAEKDRTRLTEKIRDLAP